MSWGGTSSALLLVLIAHVHAQFFDFFGVQPIAQGPRHFGTEFTTKRTRTEIIRVNPAQHMTWKNTTYSFSYDGIERDDGRQRDSARGKKRKQASIQLAPTLLPVFNFYGTTQRPTRKTTKGTTASSHREIVKKKNPTREVSSQHEVPISKTYQSNDWYDRPFNNIADDYNKPSHEVTTRPYNNRVTYNSYNTNDYTTKNPIYTRPGVKPIVVDDRPPITNKPVTQRPYWQEPQRTYRPETERPQTQRTVKPTVKPYIVNPIPTQAGAVVFPHEDEPPEVIRGPDEDYMSDAEKRRYIEMSERMCDKYKSLNTRQLSAIPLLPSPEPVSVNVSECAPTQIPLVVGGKVVTINEFPHMALLGWVKIDGGGYSWKCGGSLISDQFVLTAAHCSYEERDNTVITGPPRVVQLGSSYLDDAGALVVRVAAIIRHPKYKFPKSYYDLALLKLIQPVTFSEVIKPACLGVPPPVDQPVIATGWGKTEFGGDQSVELRSVSLPVWDMARCTEILGTSRKMPQGPLQESQMCAGEKRGGKDTCQGDSGGPAQIQDGCAWRVVAVTSLGRSCGAPNTPGLYALVQRAFVAAAVFGNYKNRRSDNSQPVTNNNNNNGYTTQSYKVNTNHRTTTTTTESYYNPNPAQDDYGRQNYNSKTTTTKQPYYNPPQDDYDGQSYNRRTTSTTKQPYYNPPQDDYGRQSYNRRTTTTTESYYNPQQDDYGRQFNNNNYRPVSYDTESGGRQNGQVYSRPLDTGAGYYDRQRDRDDVESRPHTYNRRTSGGRYEPEAIWFTK